MYDSHTSEILVFNIGRSIGEKWTNIADHRQAFVKRISEIVVPELILVDELFG